MKSATAIYERTARHDEREQLILGNIDYVARILSTMSVSLSSAEERENLQSAGVLGLVEAANSFDASRGVAFRTFAYTRIRGAIIDELRKMSPVSQQVLQQIGVLRRAHETLEPPVTPEMLAAQTDLTLDQVYVCLEAMRFSRPEGWNDLSSVVHGSWKSQPDNPEYEIEKREMKEVLASSIQQLPERERLVLTLYYKEELNLAEIGKVISISESRVSRVLAGARFRLQEIVKLRMA